MKPFLVLTAFILNFAVALGEARTRSNPSGPVSLWGHDNLVAWCVEPWDAKKRGPVERAQMLAKLGFRHYAYIGPTDTHALDSEIEALKKHGVDLLAWYFPLDADDPLATQTLDGFRRHGVHPQLWVPLRAKNSAWPKTQKEWEKLLPDGPPMPRNGEDDNLSAAEQAELHAAMSKVAARVRQQEMPKPSEEQQQRLAQDTERIRVLANLAKAYGVKVELYNHNGWFGMMDNQVAIIEIFKQRGVTDVGIVYNFSYARDEMHDDSKNFPASWRKIQPYVVEVNVTGLRWENEYVFPSQGDSELAMMRTIQESGWNGPVGLVDEKGGDAEVTRRNYMIGMDWLPAEQKQSGSGGPAPFSFAPEADEQKNKDPDPSVSGYCLTTGPVQGQTAPFSDQDKRDVTEYPTGSHSLLLAGTSTHGIAAAPCPKPSKSGTPLKLLIVTGGHEYEPSEFFSAFNAMANVRYQHVLMLEGKPVAVPVGGLGQYDVVLFYDMEPKTITPEWRSLLERGNGFVFLHHALGSFPESPEFKAIVGGHANFSEGPQPAVPSSSFHENQTQHYSIIDHQHPATCGISDFDMTDEAYDNIDIDPAAHVLMKSDFPKLSHAVAWTWNYAGKRVFYLEPGHGSFELPPDHGPTAYQNESFRKVLNRGILWAAGRL